MTDTKPLPPTASAEGETAALQAQVIDAGTLDKDHIAKDINKSTITASKLKQSKDAGFKNYIVSQTTAVGIRRADI